MCTKSSRLATWTLIAVVTSAVADADIINVPADQPTIQAGIDVAINGDEVVVAPGTYEEIINLSGKAITLRSSDGAASTVIDATNVADPGTGKPVVRIDSGEGPDTVLEGFTLTGGTGDTSTFGVDLGGGVFCNGASPIIRSCIIENHVVTIGAGAFATAGEPMFDGCTIQNNTAPTELNGFGGGMYLFDAGATITGCAFQNNWSSFNGGGLIIDVGDLPVTIEDTLFESNTADRTDGGAISASWDGPLTINRCAFIGNICNQVGGGAIRQSGNGAFFISNSRFRSNSAFGDSGEGGAVRLSADHVSIINCEFFDNFASAWGGALYLSHPSTTRGIVMNCSFANNTAIENGAAIAFIGLSEASIITNSIFWGHSGTETVELVPTQPPSTPPVLNYCIYEGGWTGDGVGNLDADPLFVDFAAGDLRLSNGSPAIDSGDTPTAAAVLGPTDLDNNPRLLDDPDTPDAGVSTFGLTIDRGAYEFGYQIPESTGACCLPGGDCSIGTSADCDAAGGVYQCDGSDCNTSSCPLPDGACCLPFGDCIDVDEDHCYIANGIYQGNNTQCVDTACQGLPSGACCLPSGECMVGSAEECGMAGGVYEGNNAACDDVSCPDPLLADLDFDGDVDLTDYMLFQMSFTGTLP